MIARVRGCVGILLMAAVVPLSAQRAAGRPRAALLRDIQQVFMNQAIREMALNDEQAPRFRRVVGSWAQKRAALEADDRTLRQSLSRELTPGVAANADSVAHLVDAIDSNRVAYSETFGSEMRDLAPILTPVQRGQFQMARDRLLQKVQQLQAQRAGTGLRQQVVQQP